MQQLHKDKEDNESSLIKKIKKELNGQQQSNTKEEDEESLKYSPEGLNDI